MILRCLWRHQWVVDAFSLGQASCVRWNPSVCLRCDRCGKRLFIQQGGGYPHINGLEDEATALCWVKAQGEFNPGELRIRKECET